MSFRSDTRARVPFAYIGALLLLTSSMYATAATPPAVREPVSPAVIDRAQTTARASLSAAIRDAGREAGRRPLLEPADSAVGRLLDGDRPFHRYLRLLIALHARQALANVSADRAGVTATVSLPPIRSRRDAARALENVTIRPATEGKFRIDISGLRVDVARHRRHTDTIRYNASFVLTIPVIRLHEDVEAYQSRLDAGITQPGLTQTLTPRLFAITWARGYAQYGGAPISNVLANRHVEVMTNDALLAQQSAVFGATDSDARRATRRAATNVALRDGFRGAESTIQDFLKSGKSSGEGRGSSSSSPVSLPSSFDRERSYDVDRTADETFVDFVDGGTDRGLRDVLDAVYRAEVRADTDVRYRDTERDEEGTVPPNATLAYTDTSTVRRLVDGTWRDSDSGSVLRTFDGTVTVEHRVTRVWMSNTTPSVTTDTRRRIYDVDIDVRFRYLEAGIAPSRGMRGRPFEREVRSSIQDRAVSISGADDPERLAFEALDGNADTDWTTVDVEPPTDARETAYEATAELRDRSKTIDVSLETRSIATAANPASRLAAKLDRREPSLVDAPRRYDSVTERAATAARLVYLQTLRDRLAGQSPMLHRAQQRLAEELQSHAIPSAPPARTVETRSSIATAVDAEPLYLSLEPSRSSEAALAARNRNVFSVPYGDTADTIAGDLSLGGGSVTLETAARTLATMESLPPSAVNESVRARRSALSKALQDSLSAARSRYRSKLADEVGTARSRDAVSDAFRRWDSPAARALAITDGGMAAAIAGELDGHIGSTDRDLVAVKLRVVSHEIRESTAVAVGESVVSDARTVHQRATRSALKSAMEAGGKRAAGAAWERATGKSAAGLPAGLPLLPVPGSWYATANAWTVSVRGSYDTFAVSTPRAAPNRAANGTVEYVRTDAAVERDVDGDGRPETLGRNRAVAFSIDTGVLVVVPPGGSGVGDVDGNADERSPGW